MTLNGTNYVAYLILATGQLGAYSTGYGGLPGSWPTYTKTGQIVYLGPTGKTVFRMSGSGTNIKALFTSATSLAEPALSPDGTKLLRPGDRSRHDRQRHLSPESDDRGHQEDRPQHQNRRQQVPAAGQQAACFDRDGRQDFHVRRASKGESVLRRLFQPPIGGFARPGNRFEKQPQCLCARASRFRQSWQPDVAKILFTL